jgi:hypothetical protein
MVLMIERQFLILRMLKKADGHTRPAPGTPRRTSFPGEAAGSENLEAETENEAWEVGASWRARVGRVRRETFSASVRDFYG